MNVIAKITLQCLKENKRRTLITILGVIISVAMISAVSTIGLSFQDLMIRNSIRNYGSYEAEFYDVSKEYAEVITKDPNTREALISYSEEFVKLKDVTQGRSPYAKLCVYDMEHLSLNALRLQEGRLPTAKDEVLISQRLAAAKQQSYQIGTTLTVPVGYFPSKDTGERSYQQFQPPEYTDEFIQTGSRTLTITGVLDDSGITIGDEGYSLYLPLKGNEGSADTQYVISINTKVLSDELYEDAQRLCEESHMEKDTINYNQNLLMYQGITDDPYFMRTMIAATLIVCLIIMAGAMSLIYNAFAISLSQRSRYLGMLSSIGATRRQKRYSVFFEASVIGAIGIPIGMAAGYAGIAITFHSIQPIINSMFETVVPLRLVVTWQISLAAIVFALIILLFSAWIPARRASKISAIEAIRQSQDFAVRARDVQTSGRLQAYLGMEAELGWKNMKRSRHRYRAIVWSLTISIVLFLAAFSFTKLLQEAFSMAGGEVPADITGGVHFDQPAFAEDAIQDLKSLSEADSFLYYTPISLNQSGLMATDDLKEAKMFPDQSVSTTSEVTLQGVDQDYFDQYAKEIGLTEEERKNHPLILLNAVTLKEEDQYTRMSFYQNAKEGMSIRVSNPSQVGYTSTMKITAVTSKQPDYLPAYVTSLSSPILICSSADAESLMKQLKMPASGDYTFLYTSDHPYELEQQIQKVNTKYSGGVYCSNIRALRDRQNQLALFLSIFLYGFVVLIMLVCAANIYNTISTGIALRRQEFAVLRSIGITPHQFMKMLRFECLFYAAKSLLIGSLIGLLIGYGIYTVLRRNFTFAYAIPWDGVLIIGTIVFVLLFVSMLTATKKLRKCGIVETLRSENS